MSNIPHPVAEEDPDRHIGEQLPDPWSDPAQTDWPDMEVNTDGMDSRTELG